jgi:succinate dehydrogenase / fumarate reductase cytochrome b subunit
MSQPLPGAGDPIIQPNGRPRPLSPHLQVWRWHVTMLASILFRVTIGAASLAAMLAIGWLGTLAFGPETYARLMTCAASPPGLLVGIGLTMVLFSLLLNGGRHLINDAGAGMTVPSANLLSQIAVWGPVVLTALFWTGLFATGRVTL